MTVCERFITCTEAALLSVNHPSQNGLSSGVPDHTITNQLPYSDPNWVTFLMDLSAPLYIMSYRETHSVGLVVLICGGRE